MLINSITSDMPESARARWRVIRLDNFSELPGIPIMVKCDEGIALMQVKPKADGDLGQQEFLLGPNGLRLIPR